MPDDIVVGRLAYLADYVFDVGEGDVFGGTAADAHQMMVMGGMADAIGDGAIPEDEPAHEPLVNQQLQRAVNGCSADGGELAGEGLGGEVVIAAGDGFDDELAR